MIAESFERIHRSNLVGMGVLPLQFPDGETRESLGLTGEEEFSITGTRRRRRQGGHASSAGDTEFTRAGADRHPQGGRVLPARRDPAVRAAPAASGGLTPRRNLPAVHASRTLLKLLTAPGPSGYEQAPAAVFREAAGAFAEVTQRHGRLDRRARAGHRRRAARSAVVGHIDEIGLIVHHIDDDGFLWFTGVGGWDPVILVGQRVEIATRDGAVLGVVGKKPIHLLKRHEDRKKAPELKDLHIDIGAKDGDDARSLVRIGDVAVIAGEPSSCPTGGSSRARWTTASGCFVALEAARLVAEAGGAPGDVAGAAVAQEEITFAGARTTAFSLRPDVAIVVDVTFATDAPGIEREGARPPPRSAPAR